MTSKMRAKILGYIENALSQGYYLRSTGIADSYSDEHGGVCAIGAIHKGAGLIGTPGFYPAVMKVLECTSDELRSLDCGFEQWPVAGLDQDFFSLGQFIRNTY